MVCPFVMRFVMASPVILSDGASLDALAAYQGFATGQDGVRLLDSLFEQEGRIHCASWLYPEAERISEEAQFVRLQRVGPALNERNLAAPRGVSRFKIDNKRNEAVNILTTFSTLTTPSVWAFALGDPALVAELFSDVTSIGLKRGNGFGRVLHIEISKVEGWKGFGLLMPNGSPARALPEEGWGRDAKRGAYALGFPRWSERPERCVIPEWRTLDPAMFGALQPFQAVTPA